MEMKRSLYIFAILLAFSVTSMAQVESAGGVRKRTENAKKNGISGKEVSKRMEDFFQNRKAHDADLQYSRDIYRRLDLTKAANAPLYFPEDVVEGKQNLFRIMLNAVVEGKIDAYEFLDGREIFTDQYRVNVADMLERFGIYAEEAKGSTERNPKFTIEEADVPTNQVLDYYIIEKWEFDRRSNRMKTRVEAICPVLTRNADYGAGARYPMFWVKFDTLRPHLASNYVFTSDDNNLETCSLDDYFNLGLYDGEIYKTKNLRNLTLAEMFPDEDDLERARDSIDSRLRTYGKDLWVPSRKDYLSNRERGNKQENAEGDKNSIPERVVTAQNARKKTSTRKTAVKTSSSASSDAAVKSVRRRKR